VDLTIDRELQAYGLPRNRELPFKNQFRVKLKFL
jgi:hypothetical protein